MLSTTRKQLIERVLERDGLVFRVVFAISCEFGQTKAEIVKVIPLGKIEETENIIALPSKKDSPAFVEILKKTFLQSFVSPYQNLIFLNGSKPRAPSLC